MGALALLAVGLGVWLHVLNGQARVAQAEMGKLQDRTQAFQTERQTNEMRMRQPQNRAVLDRSRFLNDLFARKSFSWTSVMMDLERVLPAGVQVTSIDPALTPDRDVNIRLRVSGPRDLAVDLVRNLERGQRFVSPRLANESAQTQEPGRLVSAEPGSVPGGVEFDIFSGYNPLPAAANGPKASPAAEGDKSGAAAAGYKVVPVANGAKSSTKKTSPVGKTMRPPVPVAGKKPAVSGGGR
jgi:type IV pilus assembly protein PilN